MMHSLCIVYQAGDSVLVEDVEHVTDETHTVDGFTVFDTDDGDIHRYRTDCIVSYSLYPEE